MSTEELVVSSRGILSKATFGPTMKICPSDYKQTTIIGYNK